MSWSAHLFKTLGGHVREQSLHLSFESLPFRAMSEHFPMVRCCGLSQHYFCILSFSCGCSWTAPLLRNLQSTFCIFHFNFNFIWISVQVFFHDPNIPTLHRVLQDLRMVVYTSVRILNFWHHSFRKDFSIQRVTPWWRCLD